MFKVELTITAEQAGQRIDAVCAQQYPQASRSRWTKSGIFKCNNIAKKPSTKTQTGEIWQVAYA